jgi:hypothetical protein
MNKTRSCGQETAAKCPVCGQYMDQQNILDHNIWICQTCLHCQKIYAHCMDGFSRCEYHYCLWWYGWRRGLKILRKRYGRRWIRHMKIIVRYLNGN